MLQRPTAVYFALLASLLVPPLLALGCWLTQQMVPVALSVTICELIIVPLLGLAVPLLNGLVTWRLPQRQPAKLDYREGIAQLHRQVVVWRVLRWKGGGAWRE